MAHVSLEEIKKHVRADDFTADDAYLQQLIDTADAAIIRATQRSEAELLVAGGGTFPPQLRQAELMLAAHWYNQREAATTASTSAVPYAIDYLVAQFRKLV